MGDAFRSLPGVDRVIEALRGTAPDPVIAAMARLVIDEIRNDARDGGDVPDFDEIVARTKTALEEGRGLRGVINATGVLVHTNLGRAPLGPTQLEAIQSIATGYSNLEYDLERGTRGSRYGHTRRALTALTGAESAIVVNNNAAAVLLVLSALCAGREVVISRGELIEIGGEFRIPDVMAASGAKLVEVGTTNRTHIGDYERAITPETAAILKVHPSNYRVVGFTASVPARDIARLARGKGVCFIHDVGSGLVDSPAAAPWATEEPSIAAALEEGADLLTFSGDKLFGGPQAGIIVGRGDLIGKLEKHALMRALRVDKVTLAALEATADAYMRRAWDEIPLWTMALADEDTLQRRAEAIAKDLGESDYKVEATAVMSVAGGGSLPGAQIPSWGVVVSGGSISPDDLQTKLRRGDIPVIARVAEDRLILDIRTILPEQDEILITKLQEVIASSE